MAGKRIETMDLRQLIILKKQGLSNRKVAKLLQISRNTVDSCTQVFEGLNQNLDQDDFALKEVSAGFNIVIRSTPRIMFQKMITLTLNCYKQVYPMKKRSKDIGVAEEGDEKIDYFDVIRASEPIESYGVKELQRRIEAARKQQARKAKGNS